MKKGKFAQHVFITLGKLKLQINFQIFLQEQEPVPKNRPEIFFRTSTFRNIVTIFTKLTKRVTGSPRLPVIILVTYAFLTILVSYK